MAAHLRHQHTGGSVSTAGDTLHESPAPRPGKPHGENTATSLHPLPSAGRTNACCLNRLDDGHLNVRWPVSSLPWALRNPRTCRRRAGAEGRARPTGTLVTYMRLADQIISTAIRRDGVTRGLARTGGARRVKQPNSLACWIAAWAE